jgi:GAF domain-containing protein
VSRLGTVSRKTGKARRRKTTKAKPSGSAPIPERCSHSSVADLQEQLDRRTHERDEALEQQAATSEVLHVISNSPTNSQMAFNAIARSAAQLCEAFDVVVYSVDGNVLRLVAHHGPMPAGDVPLHRGTVGGRTVIERRIIHTRDLQAEVNEFPEGSAIARERGHRTNLSVPLLRGDAAIGNIQVRRQEVRPFSEKQISLLKIFADQAVIAIENAGLLNELRQSLEQQTATAEVLRVISSSPGDPEPVFQAMLENAVRICEATFGILFRFERDVVRPAGMVRVSPEFAEFVRHGIRPSPVTAVGRVAASKKAAHIIDLQADPGYRERDPMLVAGVELAGIRTLLAVPLLKESTVIGVIGVYRQEVRPFTDKQIELVTNFAAQAVIAIENARLLNELRQRTADLSESLEQQTATSEVLRVISSSPGELGRVFDAMLSNATRICEAKFGIMILCEDDAFQVGALHNVPPALADLLRRGPIRPGPNVSFARAVKTKQPVQYADVTKEQSYIERDPLAIAAVELGGYRTILSVPMLKEGEPIGVIVMFRQEVRAFGSKQIELVQNFAAQAVIAIENGRLLNELRQRTNDLTESLEQQTATSKVLEVISRSAFDLQAVFETVAESSVRLCGADRAFIYRFDGELLRTAVALNASQELREFLERNPIRPGRHSAGARAALERRTVHISDVLADPEYTYGAKDVEKIRTVVAVPILKGDDLLGIMIIYHLEGVRPFTDKQIALVETFADQAAIAIENVRLLDELRHRTAELSRSVSELHALGEVSQAVSSTLDLETVLSTIVAKAVQLSGTEAGAIYGYDEQLREFRLRATYGMDKELIDALSHRHIDLHDPNVAEVFAQREPIQVADLRQEAASELNKIALRAGYPARMVAPLLRGEDIVGMLVVRRRTPGEFAKNIVEIIKTFAAQSALAILNAGLFNEIENKSRQLEEASQHKSQFLANMSHELRTPLNAILGYTELMADGAYGEPSEKMLGILKRLEANGRHLLGLINDVLDLSKIEAGQLELELADYSVQDIAQTVRSTLEPLAADKKLGFKLELAPQLPPGRGDGRRLTQLLINLVGNAIKFTDAGEVAIKAEANNDSFHVSVCDTGPGISATDQAKLFQEFQQANNAITRKKGGTGLGLAISKRIIEMHGGRIWVESQPGEGSTFAFTLPVVVERQVEPAA